MFDREPTGTRESNTPRQGSSRASEPALLRLLPTGAGNRAVRIAVQRLLTVQRTPVTTDAQFTDAVNHGDLDGAMAYLVTLPIEKAQLTVGKLNLAQCEALLPKVGPTQHTARGALLIQGFTLTKGSDWVKAAQFVSVLDNPGIDRQVAGLSSDAERKQLGKGARNSPSGGDPRLLDAIRSMLRRADGQLFGAVTVQTTPTDGSGPGWSGGGRPFFFQTDIAFAPDPDVVDASQIGFIQTIRTVATGKPKKSEESRKGVDKRLNDQNEAIDRDPSNTSGWMGEKNDGSFAKGPHYGVTLGSVLGGTPSPALMTDRVDSAQEETTWSFETCITARDGVDKGLIYAVVNWEFKVDDKRKIYGVKNSVTQRPTKDFGTAMAAWNRQAAGSAPSPTGQKQLAPVH